MKKAAIIVAGGSGSRMKSDLPKQFIEIGGMPILIHTMKQFMAYDAGILLKIVLPETQITFWESLCLKYQDFMQKLPHEVIIGGETRFQSAKNGISAIHFEEGLVAIHDGVRPFVSKEIIGKSFEIAQEKGSAVVCVPLKDSARVLINGYQNQAIDRTLYRLIQTPQTFQLSILRKAYQNPELPTFTDDASVVEAAGFKITLIEGSYENIKITTPEDLLWAEVFLGNSE